MANYRFKAAEIEAMKKNILTHIEHEAETKTAWRLRCAIEGQLMCCRPSKREAARLERELALYEGLTKNDLPNWHSESTQATTPAETPLQSTQAAEAANCSAEKAGNKAVERAKTWLCSKSTFDIQPYGKNKALYISVDMDTPPRYHVMVAFWEKNRRYEGGKKFTNRQINIDGEECYFGGSSFPPLQAARDFVAGLLESPQSPEVPQMAQSITSTDKRAQIA